MRRHSRLSGSRDVERWAGQAATGLQKTYQENVLGPLAQLRDELFKTFRWAAKAILTQQRHSSSGQPCCGCSDVRLRKVL